MALEHFLEYDYDSNIYKKILTLHVSPLEEHPVETPRVELPNVMVAPPPQQLSPQI